MSSPDNEILQRARRMIGEFGASAASEAERYSTEAIGNGQYEAATVWLLVRDRIAILQRRYQPNI